MQVLRMEDDEGLGPFVKMDSDEFQKHVSWARQVVGGDSPFEKGISPDETHPHHMHDVQGVDENEAAVATIALMLGFPTRWKVAVKDENQFLHWFPASSFDYFSGLGFHLARYEVPSEAVRYGKWQVMFDSDQAKLLAVEDLHKLAK